MMNLYSKKIPEVFELLNSGPDGISSFEAKERLAKYGLNKLPEPKTDNFFRIFLNQFKSPLIYILLVSASFLLAIGEFSDALIIFFVLLFNASVGVFQEGKAQNTLLALKKFVKTNAVVIREGHEIIIPDQELVPGDVIILQEGQKVPADARLISVNNLKVDEAALTGESKPVTKISEALSIKTAILQEQKNMVFKGTHIVSGNGVAIVGATGVNTIIGKISKEIAAIDSEVPLKKNIRQLSKLIIAVAFLVSALLFIFGIIVFNQSLIEMFKLVVAISVSFIPEGLPVVMTIVLAKGAWAMAKRNALVKKLQAVEALGQAKIIAVDKTGTLTKNQMIVTKAFIGGKVFEITGSGYDSVGNFFLVKENDKKLVDLKDFPYLLKAGQAAVFNAQAKIKLVDKHIFKDDALKAKGFITENWSISGDPTEAAILVFGQKMGFKKENILRDYPLIKELPFNYHTKYHATINGSPENNFLTVIGAPEIVLNFCSKTILDNKEVSLNKVLKEKLEKQLHYLLNDGLRVVALAIKEGDNKIETIEKRMPKLTFLGFLGVKDPLREGVVAALKKSRQAGIKIVMITGDHKITAKAVAIESGIYKKGDEILTGEEIDKLSDKDLRKKINKTTVFARVTPEHKLKIIQAYRALGKIVAMTGDGVNDAPSLVAADLGVAMGKIGTEVAKEAADIVLLDDNLGSIVSAIEEGRAIFDTVKKILRYLFSTNLAEIITISVSLFFISAHTLPLTPSQIIWLNFVTDGFLVVALTMEPNEKKLLKKNSQRQSKFFLSFADMRQIFLTAVVIASGAIILFSFFFNHTNAIKTQTITLTTLAMFQWFRAWEARSNEKSLFKMDFFSNKYLIVATIIIILLQLNAIYNPFLQKILKTAPLTLTDWIIIFFISSMIIIFEEIRKYYNNHLKKHLA